MIDWVRNYLATKQCLLIKIIIFVFCHLFFLFFSLWSMADRRLQSQLYSSGSETAPPSPALQMFKFPNPKRNPQGGFRTNLNKLWCDNWDDETFWKGDLILLRCNKNRQSFMISSWLFVTQSHTKILYTVLKLFRCQLCNLSAVVWQIHDSQMQNRCCSWKSR